MDSWLSVFCDKYFADSKYRIVMQDIIFKVKMFVVTSKSVKVFSLEIFRLYGNRYSPYLGYEKCCGEWHTLFSFEGYRSRGE